MKLHAMLFMALVPFLIACKPTHYTPKSYQGRQIVAGSGGGVSGMIKEYTLLENGQLFVSKGLKGEWRELKSLKRGQTLDIFKQADELGLEGISFDQPGNMTYYLIVRDREKSHEIKWGASGVAPPAGVTGFYQYLLSIF